MNIKLKEFQQKAVDELKKNFFNLWKNGKHGSELVFKSPTGSGKTIVTAEFLKHLTGSMQFEEDKAFVWISFSEDSYIQSKNKLEKYYNNNTGLHLLDLNDIQNGKLEKNDVFFVNWQKLVSKAKDNRKLRTDTESSISFDTFIKNTHSDNRKIVLIIDESHLAKDTDLANEIIKILNPKIELHISATPKYTPSIEDVEENNAGFVSVKHKDVINEGLIKEKIEIMPVEEIEKQDQEGNKDIDELLLNLALSKRNNLLDLYKEEGVDINPLVLIQLPNDEKEKKNTEGQNKLSFTKEYLQKAGVEESKIATWFSGEKENLDDIVKNNSEVEFLIFKQAVATGWDCPRAQVLVMFREIRNPIFKTQVLGRILRMPEAKHYQNNSVLNKAYVYTSYQLQEIEDQQKNEIGANKLAYKKSILREGVENIVLPSVFLKRGKYNDLGLSFQKTFIAIANEYFDLTGKEVFGQLENKFKAKGFDITQQNITNNLIVNAEIEVYDNFVEELKNQKENLEHESSRHDVEKLYNLLMWKEIANQQEENKKYAPERSWGKLKSAINVWMKEHLEIQNPPLYAVVCNDLLKESSSVLKKVIALALERYKPIREKEENHKLKKAEEKLLFNLQEEYAFTDDFEEIGKISKSAITPFYSKKNYDGKINEEKFIAFLEKQNIDWWFKNGDFGRDYFAIKYLKNNETKLFYPDFIVKQGNKIGIFDTKGGQTAETSKEKAEALQKFIKENSNDKQKLWGGIVIQDSNGIWKLNQNKIYQYNEKDLIDWIDLEF